jgi:hypothetical protein
MASIEDIEQAVIELQARMVILEKIGSEALDLAAAIAKDHPEGWEASVHLARLAGTLKGDLLSQDVSKIRPGRRDHAIVPWLAYTVDEVQKLLRPKAS